MGTNYYFFTRSKRLAQGYFAQKNSWGISDIEYELTDEPCLGYEIHLNKCSMGWRPLFQIHKAFRSFTELEEFYLNHQRSLKIFDEYGKEYSWDDYKEIIVSHGKRDPVPMKWVYEDDRLFGKTGKKYLHTTICAPEEAEIWSPFDHLEYARLEKKAATRLHCFDSSLHYSGSFYSHNDDKYLVDWANGDFG